MPKPFHHLELGMKLPLAHMSRCVRSRKVMPTCWRRRLPWSEESISQRLPEEGETLWNTYVVLLLIHLVAHSILGSCCASGV